LAAFCATSTKRSEQMETGPSMQKTIRKSVSISGMGLFTAEKAILTIHPADLDTGLIFHRSDLPEETSLVATLQNVVSTPRCTILGNKHFTIHTVEHVLAALSAFGIDNARLELSGPEVPIMDGSSGAFVEAILEAGIAEQEKEKTIYALKAPISWSKGDVHLIALPSSEYRVSYTLHFPNSTAFQSQYFSSKIDADTFTEEIGPCRTFCLYEEILPFIEQGLIKGGDMNNAIIIKEDKVLNPEGLRFSDEMVRHKILDLVGDFSLIPFAFKAHIIAIRSGHASNIAFAGELYNQIKMEMA